MSGLLGKSDACVLNEYPRARTNLPTRTSGAVSFPRILAMHRRRCSGVRTSTTNGTLNQQLEKCKGPGTRNCTRVPTGDLPPRLGGRSFADSVADRFGSRG